MAKLQERARDRASDARPYIERALKDEKVREDLKSAITTARDIYDQLLGGRAFGVAAAKVATDKDIQQQLREALDDLRDAADRVQGKSSHAGRNATLLFAGGKYLIALYVGGSDIASSFGAAGALIVLLLWIFYSAQIFLLGAEFTRAWACVYGSRGREGR